MRQCHPFCVLYLIWYMMSIISEPQVSYKNIKRELQLNYYDLYLIGRTICVTILFGFLRFSTGVVFEMMMMMVPFVEFLLWY